MQSRVGFWGWVLDGERSVGQWDREENGEQRGEAWPAGLGRRPGAQGLGPAEALVLTACLVQSRNLMLSRAGRAGGADAPEATDFFLEAVKVIDLSQDRLKGTKRFS